MKEIGEIKKKIKPTDPETSEQSKKKKNHQQYITLKKKNLTLQRRGRERERVTLW